MVSSSRLERVCSNLFSISFKECIVSVSGEGSVRFAVKLRLVVEFWWFSYHSLILWQIEFLILFMTCLALMRRLGSSRVSEHCCCLLSDHPSKMLSKEESTLNESHPFLCCLGVICTLDFSICPLENMSSLIVAWCCS